MWFFLCFKIIFEFGVFMIGFKNFLKWDEISIIFMNLLSKRVCG